MIEKTINLDYINLYRSLTSKWVSTGEVVINPEQVGKILIILAIFMLLTGMFVYFLGRTFHLPRLPGDIYFKKDNFTFYLPIVTCIVVSLVLTAILNLFFWLMRR